MASFSVGDLGGLGVGACIASVGDVDGVVAADDARDDAEEDVRDPHALEKVLAELVEFMLIPLRGRLPARLPTRRKTCPPKLTTRTFAPWRSAGTPMEDRMRLRPLGVKGDARVVPCSLSVGDLTRSGARITLRGSDLILLEEPILNGICDNSSCLASISVSVDKCSTTLRVNPPRPQSTQSGAGRDGLAANEGMGISPGRSMRRSAHL